MSNQPTDKSRDLEAEKERIRIELDELEKQLEESVKDVSEDVSEGLSLQGLVKQKPLLSLSLSVAAGFLLSYRGKKRTGESSVFSQAVKRELADFALKQLSAQLQKLNKNENN